MKPKKYKGVFKCGITGEETTQEFEDWVDDDGDLVCTIGQVVEDWAYGFYDKGPYTDISFEEFTIEEQEDALATELLRKIDTKGDSYFLNCNFENYHYNIFRDRITKDWYMQIHHVDEKGYLFSGWWFESEDKNIRAAIVEAIRYAGILE